MVPSSRSVTSNIPNVASTSPENWRYISEGGASVIFSYSGPSHPIFTGTVLRIRKATPTDSGTFIHFACPQQPETLVTDQFGFHSSTRQPDVEVDDPTVEFQEKVISKLIPPDYLPCLTAVRVERAWLERLHELREHDRPMGRRSKFQIDTRRRKAVLATDLVGGDGWTIEIKPKWGFLPNPLHLSSETRGIKTRHCRYCMHTHYKSLKGEIAARGYCPLDLFSGNEARVAHALRCLWEAWMQSGGTVNNLKLFVMGGIIDPTDIASISLLAEQMLERTPDPPTCEANLKERFVTSLLQLLLKTPLLRTLSDLQRTLDPLDIEGLSTLWKTVHAGTSFTHPLGSSLPDPTIDTWQAFVATYLDSNFQSSLSYDKPDVTKLHYFLLAYLLSASFKDCSIIIHLARDDTEPGKLTVIDLDPKKMTNLARWERLDRDIVNAYGDVETSACVDGGSSQQNHTDV